MRGRAWSRRLSAARANAVLAVVGLLWGVPLLWALATSLHDPGEPLAAGGIGLSGQLSLANYREAWESAPFVTYYVNTIIIVSGILAVQLVTITLAGYAFARVRFWGREAAFTLFLFQLMTPLSILLVPNFLTMRDLHLVNHKLAIMLPYMASGFGVFLMRQAFRAIPADLEESARLDGCAWWQVLRYVYLPLTRPALVAFSVVSVTFHWNDFLWPLVVTNTPDARPLTVGLASFTQAGEAGAQFPLIMAGTVMVIAPLLVGFLVFQRQFISSFVHSGLK